MDSAYEERTESGGLTRNQVKELISRVITSLHDAIEEISAMIFSNYAANITVFPKTQEMEW